MAALCGKAPAALSDEESSQTTPNQPFPKHHSDHSYNIVLTSAFDLLIQLPFSDNFWPELLPGA
jgi:hypothetical protein